MESNLSFFSLPFVDNADVDFSKIKCDYDDLHPTLPSHGSLLGADDDVLAQFLSGDEPLEEPDLNGPTTLHCEICKKQFDNAKKYYGHLRVHSKDNLWICDKCPNEKFSTKQQLMKHSLIHKPLQRVWQCPQCDMSFEALWRLQQHLFAKHLDYRPHKCDTCEMSFHKLSDLEKHHDIHDDVKKHECEVCKVKFRDLSNMKRHMLSHGNEKPYACPGCGNRFKQLASMKRHIQRCGMVKTETELTDKTIRKNYCRICGLTFNYKSALLEHSVRQHSDNVEPSTLVKASKEDKTNELHVDANASVIVNKTCPRNNKTSHHKNTHTNQSVKTETSNALHKNTKHLVNTHIDTTRHHHKRNTSHSVTINTSRPLTIDTHSHPVIIDTKHIPDRNINNPVNINKNRNLNLDTSKSVSLDTTSHTLNRNSNNSVKINTKRNIHLVTSQTINKNSNNPIDIITNCNLNLNTSQSLSTSHTFNKNISHPLTINTSRPHNLDTSELMNTVTTHILNRNTHRQLNLEASYFVNIDTSHSLNRNISHPISTSRPLNLDINHAVNIDNTLMRNISNPVNTSGHINLDTSHPVNIDTSQPVNTSRPLNLSTSNPVLIDTSHFVNINTSRPLSLATTQNTNLDTGRPVNIDSILPVNIDTNRTVDNIVDDILSAEDDYLIRHPTSNQMLNYNPPETENHDNLMQIELLKDMNQMHILDDELLYNDLDFDSFQTMCNTNDMDYTDRNELLFDIADGRSIDQDLMNALYQDQVKGDNIADELLNQSEILNTNEKANDFLINPVVSVNECSTIFESDVDLEASTNLAANLNQLIGENSVQYISTEHDDTFIISLNSEIDAEQLTDMLNIGVGTVDESTKSIVKETAKEKVESGPQPIENVTENIDVAKSTSQTIIQPILVKMDGVTDKENIATNPVQNTKAVKTKKRVVYVCRKCNKIFNKKDNYKSHRATHDSSLRLHKCWICNERFSYRSTLNKHVKKQHTPLVKAAHECTQCDKSYDAAWMLKRHLTRDHEMLLPFTCEEKGCGKHFYKQCDLDIHKRFHADERPYTCDICNRGFHLVSHFKRHVRNVDCTTKIIKKAASTKSLNCKTVTAVLINCK